MSNPTGHPIEFISKSSSKSAHLSPSLLLTPSHTQHHVLPGLLQPLPTWSPHFLFHPPLTHAPQTRVMVKYRMGKTAPVLRIPQQLPTQLGVKWTPYYNLQGPV